ncbi:MAG: SusC/RagA family TonB-linked outer membrane protein [Prevotella sp.]
MKIKAKRFIAIICILMAYASLANAQQISVSYNKKSFEQVVGDLRKKTGYEFLYQQQLVKDKPLISFSMKKAYLKDILDHLCYQIVGIDYEISRNTVIFKKPEVPKKGKNRALKGIVVDQEGKPLPGVTIKSKDGKTATTSFGDGTFGMDIPDSPLERLIFSFVGMKTIEKAIGNEKVLKVVMEESEELLQEVVSIGYSVIPKDRATGAIDIVSKEQLSHPTTDLSTQLIGSVAGLASKLDADGKPTFEIRGQTSLYADAQPLLVVDGFAIEGGFENINPNDIESVTVLKDAAAASIWGARSANGVIVVTTKKGKGKDKLNIEFNSFIKVGSKLDLDYSNPLASSSETVDYESKAYGRWGAISNNGSLMMDYAKAFSQALTAINENQLGNISQQELDATLSKLRGQDNRDQIRDNLLAVPLTQQYNLSISSSTNKAHNYISLMYSRNQTKFKNSHGDNYMFNFRNSTQIAKWLDLSLSAMIHYKRDDNSGSSLSTIQKLSPYDMLLDASGNTTDIINSYYKPIIDTQVPKDDFPYSDWSYNPITEMNNRSIISKDLNMRYQAGLTFKLLDGLTFDTRIQYETDRTVNNSVYNEATFFVRNIVNTSSTWNKTAGTVTQNVTEGAIKDESKVVANSYNFRNQLNFNREFHRHAINALVGTEISHSTTEGTVYPTVYGYDEDRLTVGGFPNGVTVRDWMYNSYTFNYQTHFTSRTTRYFSLYANAAYTFDKKYSLSASIRTDASNLITDDPKYRYSPFWSIGGKWNLTEEKFMQQYKWVNNLVMRLTYGYNGNVDTSTSVLPLISISSNPDIYTNEYHATIQSYGNPSLRWEKVRSINWGVDFSLLNNKLFGKVDFYHKQGKDLLAVVSTPSLHGTTQQKINNAEMTNKGIELTLGTNLNLGDFLWTNKATFAYNTNKITKLFRENYYVSDLCYGGTGAYVEDMNSNTLWAFTYGGVENVGSEEQPDWQPVIIDNSDGTSYSFAGSLPYGDGTKIMVAQGTTVAPYTASLSSSLVYKNCELSLMMTGKFGHKFRHHSFNYPVIKGKTLPNARYAEVASCDPSQMVPLPINDEEIMYYNWSSFYPYLDYLTDNAMTIRMQEIYLAYHLPKRILDGIGISGLKLYMQGNNLFNIVNNKYGEDPENPLGTYKLQPQYTFGLTITL